jgi:bacterioferritin
VSLHPTPKPRALFHAWFNCLNEDLAGEYQAIIAYTVYSQMLKGAAYTDIARELELHAVEELQHAIKIAKQIDYLAGRV